MSSKTSISWSDDFNGLGRTYILKISRVDWMNAKFDAMDRALFEDIDKGGESDTPIADQLLGLETLVRRIEQANNLQDIKEGEQMTFKEELEKILEQFASDYSEIDANDYYNEKEYLIVCDQVRDEALTSIINLVDKELPLRVEDAINDSRVPYIGGWSEGYNQAIDDMRAKLKGVR